MKVIPMQMIKSEKGAALILTIMIITLFFVFILVLFTQVTNTMKQVTTMEKKIDAQLMAEMGVDYIEAVLNDFQTSDSKSLDDFIEEIPKSRVYMDSDNERYFEIVIQPFNINDKPESILYESKGVVFGNESTIENTIELIWE